MSFTTTENNVDYINSVKTQRRDWFLAAMFLPLGIRNSVLAIHALDVELEHVHHVVKEEMIGHIRYAWWQENIEALGNPAKSHNHPLLQALAAENIPMELLLPIVTAYREAFPQYPTGIDEIVMNAVRNYIDSCHTELVEVYLQNSDKTSRHARVDKNKWDKATAIISNHRKKYAMKYNNWLLIKLLFI